ncbi:hypothetical protein ACFTWS_05580 [Streptomyces sp. NPDC057027]|uniref:hypothetical protein n=1 Tax=Streptomyces sp. NPDC057027 TaxID=3346004 RepID=UPI003636147E
MTPEATVVWTLLPDPAAPRTDDGTVRLSLVFGFQLAAIGVDPTEASALTLDDFPRVRDWPDLAFSLGVTFREEGGKTTSRTGVVDPIPRAALWKSLFPPSTPVSPYLFDEAVTTDPVQSYPVQAVSRSLREEYGRLFTAVDGPAVPVPVDPRSRPVRREDWQAVDALVRTVGAQEGGPAARSPDADPFAALLRDGVLADEAREDPLGWLRVADFHEPFAAPLALRGTAAPSGVGRPPDRDFHGILAALAEHPGLMSLVGLIRRVKVPLPEELAGAVAIQADPATLTLLRKDLPFTRCVVREGRLFLAGRNGTQAALHLPLDDAGRYAAHTVDVDAGALALRSYADMLAGLPRTEPPPVLLAPALHSDGIFVAEKDRQVAFRTVLKESKDLNDDLQQATEPGKAITLHADRVLQGYRVDVFDEKSGRWYPLCRRAGHYTVRGVAEPVPIDDEGSVTDALTRGSDAQDHRVSRLHQSLFRWNGWSLVAEPPGKMLDVSEHLADPGPTTDAGLPFSSTVRPADGTLPSLRYGRSYRFRARLVDLAGRSLPFTDRPTAGEPATAPLLYTRYEPVPAPVLVPRRPVTPGESLTVLVVRTDNADPAAPVLGLTCERHLLAPKAAVQMLERHGVLDVVGQHRLDPAVHALLSRLDGGVVTGERDLGAGGTPYVDVDAMTLPWLPDPLSQGAVFLGLPQTSELLAAWPHGNGWHERLPVRFVVVPGKSGATPPPVFNPAGRLIRVTLPPAADVTTLLSSMLTRGDEELLGLWHWFAEAEGRSAEEIDDARERAVAGHVAQLTPTTTLRLIHAVRCPVDPPAFGRPGVERGPKETAYVLDDPALTVHGPSTLSVHVEAMWNEVADDPTQSTPTYSTGRAVLHQGEDRLRSAAEGGGSAAPAAVAPFRSRHDVHDTRHRAMRFTPVGTSSFVPYFTDRRTVRLTAFKEAEVATSFVPGTVVVRAAAAPLTAEGTPAAPGRTYTLDQDYQVNHETGRVARKACGAIADGADVDVSFVVPPVTRAGSPVTLHVPASVRPPAPAVHSVVPAFQWKDESTGGMRVSVRQGGVVRVYLQRPWYVSGEGELLAVRVLGQNAQPDATSQQWATMWGRDPVRQAGEAPPIGFPRPSDLLNAVDVQVSGGDAMGYPVAYDEQRQLWYADIRFQAQRVYQPFVRLRVARLQPDALRTPEDLRLSPGVDAGFVQIPVHRRASVTVSAAGTEASVTLAGPLPPKALGNFTTTVIVGRQVLGSESVDDPAQWRTVGTPGTPFPTGIALPLVEATGPLARWTGTVPLASTWPGPGRQRLLVMEVDEIGSPRGLSRRISYLDTFTI